MTDENTTRRLTELRAFAEEIVAKHAEPMLFDTVFLLAELGQAHADLKTLIAEVNKWAGRPTKFGARNLRDIANQIAARNGVEE